MPDTFELARAPENNVSPAPDGASRKIPAVKRESRQRGNFFHALGQCSPDLQVRPTRFPHTCGKLLFCLAMCHNMCMGKFLTIADVADYLNVSIGQVRTLIKSGDLPAIQIGGRGQWRIEAKELENYITRRYEATRKKIGVEEL